MPNLNSARVKQYLTTFDFKTLFIQEMGWDRAGSNLITIRVNQDHYELVPIAKKRLLVVYECRCETIPNRATQKKIHAELRKITHENFIIFTDKAQTDQRWFFVWRDPGKTIRAHVYDRNEDLRQRLETISFSLKEEETLSPIEVLSRVRSNFDVDRVTKRFYDVFKKEHTALLKFLEGIPDKEMKAWYVSVTLNRLMFVYFIQKQGFLNNNTDYLRDNLEKCKKGGQDRFYKEFLCPLFFNGFAQKDEERDPATRRLLGDIPYLNGGIFQRHQLEERYGEAIQIPDRAFDQLFSFFEKYRWHLDDRSAWMENENSRDEPNQNEINPDVLGYIFEKYINKKQMGAYYTKEDITGYISRNTIIPWLFDQAQKKCKIAFEGERSVWDLLQAEPQRYIYPAVQKGCELPLPPEIEAGIQDVSQRGLWNTPAPEEYALPTEIWRETVARRQRYEEVKAKLAAGEVREINDLITYNLDIELFAQDVIQNVEGPEVVRAFWKALTSIKILDPTVGSGAFLFAAMNILEPLYEDCIEQMEHFVFTLTPQDSPEKFKDFKTVLDQIGEHANPKYYIYKTITIRNLYGVDIMEEAVETCKLRLFLKLVSQVERRADLEPLPDIDFNVRAGNTLVGFTSLAEAGKALSKAKHNQDGSVQNALLMTPDEENQLQRIEEEASLASQAYARFQEMQTEKGADASTYRGAKEELQQRLEALNEELNHALALSYGVNPENEPAYQKWMGSHQPFHWVIDFYDIIRQGGFDVVIGNPPYVEYRKVKKLYEIQNFSTEDCGNLFAFILENSITKLLKEPGFAGFIVPISMISTKRMEPLQELILDRTLYISSYSNRPSKLFDGVEQRLCIFVLYNQLHPSEIWSTNFHHWNSIEREYLLDRIYGSKRKITNDCLDLGKIGNSIHLSILEKIEKMGSNRLSSMVGTNYSKESLYFHDAPTYWIRAMGFDPNLDPTQPSSHYKEIKSNTNENRNVMVCLLNSSTFYLFYKTYSNCRDLMKSDWEGFPVGKLSREVIQQLNFLYERLTEEMIGAREVKSRMYPSGEVHYYEYYPVKVKSIIDEIDTVLSTHYGFLEDELEFIINYDVKYRMGDELGEANDEDDAPDEEIPVEEQDEPHAPAAPVPPARPARKAAAAVKMGLPMEFSSYHVYRCLKCNTLIPGFDVENHTAQVHYSEYPGYEKLGG